MSLDEVPIVTVAYPTTVRLVSSARLRAAVLEPLVDSTDELALLAEIEGATSARQLAQHRGIAGLAANELVYDVPHAHFINASFAYARPQQPNRFNGSHRGAWYAALSVDTCLAEVGYHLTRFLADAGRYQAVVDYAEMLSSLAGAYVDLRQRPEHPALGADPAQAYPVGNRLAEMARAQGLNGIIYPSVRHADGTCFAALRPAAVQSVRQGDAYRMVWNGEPTPLVEGPIRPDGAPSAS